MKNPLKKLVLGLLCFSWIGFTASAGETLVGELEDELKVNNLGTASYTLPLVVSPGTAGMHNKLAITYSSRGGNGPLGIGFSLSGLNAISRAPASVDQDEFFDPVDYDEHDRFLLNGQRLELVSTTNDLSLYGTAGTEYRTEIDSFSGCAPMDNKAVGPPRLPSQPRRDCTIPMAPPLTPVFSPMSTMGSTVGVSRFRYPRQLHDLHLHRSCRNRPTAHRAHRLHRQWDR